MHFFASQSILLPLYLRLDLDRLRSGSIVDACHLSHPSRLKFRIFPTFLMFIYVIDITQLLIDYDKYFFFKIYNFSEKKK